MRTPSSGAGGARPRRKTAEIVGNRPPADIDAEVRMLPRINPAVVSAVQQMLMEQLGMNKPPEQAARFMALVYELDKQKRPFPHRKVAATALGGAQSVYTLDSAIRNALADGYVNMHVDTTTGHVASRELSVRKERFFTPSKELRETAEAAERPKRK